MISEMGMGGGSGSRLQRTVATFLAVLSSSVEFEGMPVLVASSVRPGIWAMATRTASLRRGVSCALRVSMLRVVPDVLLVAPVSWLERPPREEVSVVWTVPCG